MIPVDASIHTPACVSLCLCVKNKYVGLTGSLRSRCILAFSNYLIDPIALYPVPIKLVSPRYVLRAFPPPSIAREGREAKTYRERKSRALGL